MDVKIIFKDPTRPAAIFEVTRDPVEVTYHPGFVEIKDTYGAVISYPADAVYCIRRAAPPGRS